MSIELTEGQHCIAFLRQKQSKEKAARCRAEKETDGTDRRPEQTEADVEFFFFLHLWDLFGSCFLEKSSLIHEKDI